MPYEQNITVAAIIIVTLVVLWYIDKEIKILRTDVVHMKEALSINVQMFQKLRNAYQSIPATLKPMLNKQKLEKLGKEESKPETVEEESKPETVEDSKPETIEEDPKECKLETVIEEPLASNDVPVQKETVVKKRNTRKKIE